MRLQEYLKDKIGGDKLKDFKLTEAEFDKQQNKVLLVFVYPDGVRVPGPDLETEIKKYAGEYLEKAFKIELRFKKSFIDPDVIRAEVKKCLDDSFVALSHAVNMGEIEVDAPPEGMVYVTIPITPAMNKYCQQKRVLPSLEQHFNAGYFQAFTFRAREVGASENLDDILSAQEAGGRNLFEYALANEPGFHKVEVLEKLFGKAINGRPVYIEDVKADAGKILVAGKIKFFTKRTFVPKKKAETDDEPAEKIFYSFSLEDPSGSIQVVHFPTIASAEPAGKLADNMEVIICGSVDSFNDRISIRAMDVGLCKCSGEGKKICYREEAPSYITISPCNFTDTKQLGMFDVSVQNEFWKDREVVVFDFETTGLDCVSNQIIEIGAVKIKNGKITETFSTLINPKMRIPEDATKINGITDEMVKYAPTLESVLPDFYKFTRGCLLSAYNIDFDYGFLRTAGAKYRYNFDNEKLDTLYL
ncbi:MAG: 3'-5' exonuclease, partial [Firmicutes bacterium]|nr:3'-5' exonuclease [Bacillota bacterium]